MFNEISVAEICRHAQVSHSIFYQYYNNLTELLDEILLDISEQCSDAITVHKLLEDVDEKPEKEQLSYHYPGIERTIFQNVSFDIEKGNLVSILGPNGAGKSTLLNCMAGLFVPDKGKVCIDGISLEELGVRTTAQRIGYVPQNHYSVYDFTVLEFVVMGRTPYIGAFSSPCSEDYEKAEESLALVGAEHLSGKLYTRISGGERQLAMIARAITQERDFIFLDELTAHLDFGNQMKAVRMIQGLAEQGYGVVMTTHNPDHVLYTGGMAALLQRDGYEYVVTDHYEVYVLDNINCQD